MCIVTITLHVQTQVNEPSCVLLPLQYLYKARAKSGHVYCYHYTICTKPWKWAVMCIFTITIPVQSQGNEWSCALLPLHYLYKAMKMSGHVCCYHYTTCTKPGQWAVMCIATITQHVQSQVNEPSCVLLPLHYLYKARQWAVMCIVTITLSVKAMKMSGHVCCYHYTTCTNPGKWAVMCIVTITLPVQSKLNERSCVLLPLHYLCKARTMSVMRIVTITLPVQSQDNERSCVLLPLHYLYKAMKMSGHVCCYHYTTCTKPGQWASCVLLPLHYLYKTRKISVMCIVTITLCVQSHENEPSCVLLPLQYLCKARAMSGHVYCYHYTICTKPWKWAFMCVVTITRPVQIQDNERSCVLLPLHYMYNARYMSHHVYYYHYTTCTKPGKWAVKFIVTITLPVQSKLNERSCVLLPVHYLYKARTMSGHAYCYHYTTCAKPSR